MKKMIQVSGKRKMAIARGAIREGKGNVMINKVHLRDVTPELARIKMSEPLVIAEKVLGDKLLSSIDMDISVNGGGWMGRASAVGSCIGAALVEWTKDENLRNALNEYEKTILSCDVRRVEPKKFGGKKARKRKQKSYR